MIESNASHIAALEDLRLGVEMDRHHLDDGDAKLAALDVALVLLSRYAAPQASDTLVKKGTDDTDFFSDARFISHMKPWQSTINKEKNV